MEEPERINISTNPEIERDQGQRHVDRDCELFVTLVWVDRRITLLKKRSTTHAFCTPD